MPVFRCENWMQAKRDVRVGEEEAGLFRRKYLRGGGGARGGLVEIARTRRSNNPTHVICVTANKQMLYGNCGGFCVTPKRYMGETPGYFGPVIRGGDTPSLSPRFSVFNGTNYFCLASRHHRATHVIHGAPATSLSIRVSDNFEVSGGMGEAGRILFGEWGIGRAGDNSRYGGGGGEGGGGGSISRRKDVR